MSKVRMRYAKQALEELKRDDPETCVWLNMIRGLAKSGKVPSVQAGKGYLINFDALLEYLAAPMDIDPAAGAGGIRPINEHMHYFALTRI